MEILHQSHHHKEILVEMLLEPPVMVVLEEVVPPSVVLTELLPLHFLFEDLVRVEALAEQHLVEILEFLHLMEHLDQLREDGLLEVAAAALQVHPRDSAAAAQAEEGMEVQPFLLILC
jgi:hypothetical protein